MYESIKDNKLLAASNGYFEVETDAIHVLVGEEQELKTVFHEKAHAERQNKLTFKLARLIANPTTNISLLLALIVLMPSALITPLPSLIFSGFYATIYLCHIHEENTANHVATKKLLEVKT